jgi:hypothetical protein
MGLFAARTSSTTKRAFPLKFSILAFAFTWFFWGLAALGAREVFPALPGLTVIGTFGPLVAAVIVTAQESGRVGVRSLPGRILQWRVAPIWYGVALLGPLAITLWSRWCWRWRPWAASTRVSGH